VVEERRCFSRDGFPLAVQTSGPADAPALLLLQGQANSHHWWDGLRGQFESYRTITFDYRGTGRSRGPIGRWTTATFADDAAEVLDVLSCACTQKAATASSTNFHRR
jgi:pimeloyl-ACP methyl ester carboxylesterase